MTRVAKAPEARRAEILEVARNLFEARGFANVSVDEIVQQMGVAKGTFYYHFRSKTEVLATLARQMVEAMAEEARALAADVSLDPVTKLAVALASFRRVRDDGREVVDGLHRPENRELHERSNIETVRILGPVLAAIVDEGCAKGVFDVADSLATVQFVLAGSLFLFGEGVFDWTPEDESRRLAAMVTLIERGLGAPAGSMTVLLPQDPTRTS
jgi:AcrR family transcriptional regulator